MKLNLNKNPLKKILLTGYKGFVGSHVTKKLLSKNLSITFGNINPSDNGIMIDQDINLKEYDCICHLGASSKRSNSYSDIINKNIIHNENIFYHASKYNNLKIIYASANSIVSSSTVDHIDFSTKSKPKELYSISKLLGEELLKHYIKRKNFTIIRLPALYGRGSNKEGLIDRLIKSFMQNKEINITNNSLLINNAAIIDDVADFIVKSVIKINKFCGNDFILGSTNSMSLYDIALHIKSRFNSDTKIIKNNLDKTKKNYVLDISLAEKFGFNSKPMKLIVDKACDYYE